MKKLSELLALLAEAYRQTIEDGLTMLAGDQRRRLFLGVMDRAICLPCMLALLARPLLGQVSAPAPPAEVITGAD